MRRDVAHDFNFGRRYLPHMKMIAGSYLIGEAPDEDDMQRATDLIVLRLDAVRIACRVRRSEYLGRYSNEFTIRERRHSGSDTELGKIIAGWGDYMIYGFAGPDTMMSAWLLGDLRVFRQWFMHQLATMPARQLPGVTQPNHDGSSDFRAFKIADLPDEFVVARKTAQQEIAAA